MARPKKWPPTLQNNNGYARARDPHTGDYVSFGPVGPDAQQRYAAWLLTLTQPKADKPKLKPLAGLSVAEVLDSWWAEKSPALSRPEKAILSVVKESLTRTHGTLPAQHFDASALEVYRSLILSGDWLTSEEKKKPRKKIGLSPRTANHRCGRVRTIWRWAESRKLVPIGSWNHLRTLSPLRTLPRPAKGCTLAEVLRVGEYCPEPVRAMLELAWWTGMRPGEIRVMRGQDIDQSGKIWTYRPMTHKNLWRGHDRVVLLGEEAQRVLAPWLTEGDLFRTKEGTIYSDDRLSMLVRRAAKRAGVKGFSAYCCRHAFKDRMVREFGLDVARALMGKRSIGNANEYGTQADLELAKRALKNAS